MLQVARRHDGCETSGGWGLRCEPGDDGWSISYDAISATEDLIRALENFDENFVTRLLEREEESFFSRLRRLEERAVRAACGEQSGRDQDEANGNEPGGGWRWYWHGIAPGRVHVEIRPHLHGCRKRMTSVMKSTPRLWSAPGYTIHR